MSPECHDSQVTGMEAPLARKTAARRGKYAIQACVECKRRKVRCEGHSPCQRCVRLNLECSYPARTRDDLSFQNLSVQHMQVSLDHSKQRRPCVPMTTATDAADMHPISPVERLPHTNSNASNTVYPFVHGPTSSDFTLDILRDSFKARGVDSAMTDDPFLQSYKQQPPVNHQVLRLSPAVRSVLADPVWYLNEDEAERLIHTYCDGAGAMHPVLERAALTTDCKNAFAAVRNLKQGDDAAEAATFLALFDSTTLKLVLCIAMVMEKKDVDPLATGILDSLRSELIGSFWQLPSLQNAVNFLLAALYYFHLDEEAMAGRFICMAARVCFELGLNRRETARVRFPDLGPRTHAMVVFRCIYMLDGRLSVGVGFPPALNDSDVEQTLSEPLSEDLQQLENEDPSMFLEERKASRQYVIVMTNYIHLAGKAFRIVNTLSDRRLKFPRDEFEYLDFQVVQWQQDLPDELKLTRTQLQQLTVDQVSNHVPLFLRVVLNTKAFQLRNLLHRPVLHFPSRIASNLRYARTAVEIARESILLISAVNESTSFLRLQPVLFKHFLISALGVLLLAMANAWEELGRKVGEEFWHALDLFKVIAAESPLVMRYWKTISGLETLARKVGLQPRQGGAYTVETPQLPDMLSGGPSQVTGDCAAEEGGSIGAQMDFDVDFDALDMRNEFLTYFHAGTGITLETFDFAVPTTADTGAASASIV